MVDGLDAALWVGAGAAAAGRWRQHTAASKYGPDAANRNAAAHGGHAADRRYAAHGNHAAYRQRRADHAARRAAAAQSCNQELVD
jgi:hypothetical protein